MLETLKYLKPYITRYKRKYIAGAIFVLLTNAFRITNPKVVQHAIDYLKNDFVLGRLGVFTALIVMIAICEGIFTFLMRKSMIVASREIENDLRNDFFGKLLDLSPSFYNNMPTGDIMSRATNDLNAVRSLLGPGIAYSTNTVMAFLFVIPMMLYISPKLTMFALLPFPLVALIVNRFGKAIYKRFERIQTQLATLSTRAQENISGNTIIKWFAREEYEIEQFRKENEEYMRRNINYAKVYAAFHPSLMLTIGISIAMIILIGGRLVMQNNISLGEFTAFILYAGILIWPFIALGWVIGLFQRGSASLKRMRKILEAEPEIFDKPGMIKPEKFQGEISFNNLSFGYQPEKPVLQDIQLQIPAHSTVGIIGPTGSGKSTLVKLIPFMHKLPEGVLLIDGQDVNRLSPQHLRRRIGFVPQETFLFSATIRENIAYGYPEATQEEVEWAAEMADIHEQIVEFPNGYDSVLGEKGINLSGGQKQRVAIARAILRMPDILILDDAFSALDTQTEDRILKNLAEFFPERTVLLVSHRVSTIQNSDFIVVLDDGKVIEQGVHDELILQGGMYAWIHEKQLLEEELESVE
jgi:ATP-binding cassette subfamily B protein